MIVDKNVIVKIEVIIVWYLKIGFWELVVIILEVIFNVGNNIIYILGCFKN